MKFTDGYWMAKEGYTIRGAVEIRDIRTDDESVTAYAATRRVQSKGDTLNAALLTVRFSSPRPDVISVRISRHEGRVRRSPEFQLNEAPDRRVRVEEDEQAVVLTSGKLSVSVRKQGWQIDFARDGRKLTGSGPKAIAHIEGPGRSGYVREQLELGVDEYVYGLGERFTPFVKNGQTVDIWNEDGGTSSELAYKNVPFYVTNRGYGVFVNHPERVSYEIASENVSKVQFSVPGEQLEYCIVGGDTLKDVLDNYTALTGKPALPPAWSFGLWLTTSFTTDYDEATVNRFVDGMFERDVPLHVFHFDCFWMKEYQWCDFEWDPAVFPDPEDMLQRLKAKGLKICVWINPYIAQKSPLFREGMEKGYLVKLPSGDVWQWDMWQAGMALVDFTNPAAAAWYQSKLKRLLDMGVDCFKTDFGERIPTHVVYHDGSDPVKMHNYYTFLYNKTVFELLERERGEGEAVLFARSATAGGQRFPVHWGGDCTSTYESMAESLRGGLSLGLCGFGFWSHDIGGFERTAPPDVYKRWVAFGLLSSHSRLHGNESYRVPWLFGDEAVDVLRHFTKLKCRLMPYLYSKAVEASRRGVPVMRAMVLEFAEDPACWHLDRQYMLGDALLAAPVFREDGAVTYYVPEGRWTDFQTGRIVEGGRWLRESFDYFSLPLLARPGSLIPVGSEDTKPDYDFAANVALHLFALPDGGEAGTEVCGLHGETELSAVARRRGNTIRVEATGRGKPWRLVLRGISGVQRVEGGTWSPGEQGAVVTPEDGACALTVELQDP